MRKDDSEYSSDGKMMRNHTHGLEVLQMFREGDSFDTVVLSLAVIVLLYRQLFQLQQQQVPIVLFTCRIYESDYGLRESSEARTTHEPVFNFAAGPASLSPLPWDQV